MGLFSKLQLFADSGGNSIPELQKTRESIIDGIILSFVMFGFVSTTAGVLKAWPLQNWSLISLYVGSYACVVGMAIFREKIPLIWKVGIGYVLIFALSIVVLLRFGFSGAGIWFLLMLNVLTTVLLGLRLGFISLMVSVAAVAGVGYMVTVGGVSLETDKWLDSNNPLAWILGGALFTVLASASSVSPGILQRHLAHSLKLLKEKSEDLETTNRQLRTEMAERHRAEYGLHSSQALYHTTLHSIRDWIHVVNRDLRLEFMNEALLCFNANMGFETEVIGKRIEEVFPYTSHQTLLEYQEVLDSGTIVVNEEIISFGTFQIAVESRKTPVFEGNRVVRVVTTIHDVTESRRMERELLSYQDNLFEMAEQRNMELKSLNHQLQQEIRDRRQAELDKASLEGFLRQQQKLEAVGTLASGVAHEINNPTNIVINYATLIERRIESDPETCKEYAQEIVLQGGRIANIVRNLLEFSRKDQDHPKAEDIRSLLDGTISILKPILKNDDIFVSVDIAEGLPKLKCMRQQLQQVLLNLITNARDALEEVNKDEGKTIQVKAMLEHKHGGAWLRFVVRDNGTGIEKDKLERIFDPFYTTKNPNRGTGLGLFICSRIVQEHKGLLAVKSKEGVYTEFSIDLPMDETTA